MSDIKTGRASDQFPLRFPEGMRERIKASAEANGRSMNAEIIATLNSAYPAARQISEIVMDLFMAKESARRGSEPWRAEVIDKLDALIAELQERDEEFVGHDRD